MFQALKGLVASIEFSISEVVQSLTVIIFNIFMILTGIARLVHVNDLNLMTQILTFPCQTCSVYARKKFGGHLHGRALVRVTWKGQNLGRKVEVIYMDEPCNAC